MSGISSAGLPRQRFRDRIAARPLLVDGGMGTLLFSRGVPQRACLEELVATPRGDARRYPKGTLPVKMRGAAMIHKLLPDPIPGMDIDRFELPPGVRMAGVPHTPGTREYLTCEQGSVELAVSGERYRLAEGDVVSFRGDQRHGYHNPGTTTAIAYSAVAFAPVSSP
jgi:quercetin dioxygenase-like cupin family protein